MTGTPLTPNFESQKGNGTVYTTALDNVIAAMRGIGTAFAVYESTTPNLSVNVASGTITDASDGSLISVVLTALGPLTAPSVEPRNDIVYVVMADGTLGVATGDEAASPVDPSIPIGSWALARLRMTVSMTAIPNTSIDDLRTWAVKTDITALSGVVDEIALLAAPAPLAGLAAIGALGFVPHDVRFEGGWSDDWALLNIEEDVVLDRGIADRDFTVDGLIATIQTAPVGAALIIDTTKNGVSIWATRPQFADGSTTLTAGTLKTDGTEDFAQGDTYITFVPQVGSSTPGQGLNGVLLGHYV